MGQLQHNYPRAFAMVVQGHPLDEVAEFCDIPIHNLKEQAARQEWMTISREVATFYEAKSRLSRNLKPVDLELLMENRKKNYEQADKLRQIAEDYVEIWLNKLEAVKQGNDDKAELHGFGPKTLRELACAIATIHELTYRALGDVAAKRDPSSPDKSASAPQITINLPGVLVNPRGRKTVNVEATADMAEEPSAQTISQRLDNLSETGGDHNP